jgi:DedD protein
MDLLSLFKRESEPSASKSSAKGAKGRVAAAVADDAAQARLRARRRLIGAALLVVSGVVGFPLVFGTQPRPVAPNVPIEIVPRSAAEKVSRTEQPDQATVIEPNKAASSAGTAPAKPVLLTTQDEVLTETAADAGREVQRAASGATRAVATRSTEVEKPAPKPAKKTQPPSEPAHARENNTPITAENAAPGASSAAAQRFVVQLGAFADPDSAKDARQKAEKKGLKTYTQLLKKDEGRRIRVRIGPFDKRSEADAALVKARAAGLNGSVLVL